MSGADYEIWITGGVGAAAVRSLCDLEVEQNAEQVAGLV